MAYKHRNDLSPTVSEKCCFVYVCEYEKPQAGAETQHPHNFLLHCGIFGIDYRCSYTAFFIAHSLLYSGMVGLPKKRNSN